MAELPFHALEHAVQMNWAYLSDSTIPSQTANSVHVMRMCAALERCGAHVILLARRGETMADRKIFSFYGIDRSFRLKRLWCPHVLPGRSRLYAVWTAIHCIANRIDVAYCRCPHAALVASRLGIPTFFEAHAVPAKNSKRDLKIIPTLLTQKGFRGLIAITEALAVDLAARYGLDRHSILVAADGADVPSQNLKIKELKLPGRLCVGYVGHLYPGKGIELILPLAFQCPEVDFHVVGGTADSVTSWRAKADGLPNVTFHGFVAPDQTGRYVMACDVLLAPMQKRVSAVGGEDIGAWTSPLKIFEYMSYGRAIIASDLPVLREVLTADRNCLLAPPDDVESWRRALLQLDGNPEQRRILGTQARIDFEGNYTWNKRAQKIMTFVRSRLQPSRDVA